MSLLTFQMPEKVVVDKTTDFHGYFEFKPLEPGYGVTIGNALRRVLLSSLEGYAITSIKIPGVLHEFSAVEGIVDDVANIILNLKQVRIKRVSEVNETSIIVRIKGQEAFTAGHIDEFSSAFKVLNPEHVIFTCDSSLDLEIELTVDKGRGYLPAEEQVNSGDQPYGLINIDAIYTPIKNVKFNVENTRVEQKTDFEKLKLEIETDGSIHPEDALKGAANILMQHLMLFSEQTMTFEVASHEEEDVVDEEFLHMRKLLKTFLSELDLSVRAYNCLKAANVKTLGDLAQLEVSDMMKFRNFGKKSLTELEQLMADKALTFGMDLTKYKLDED